MDIRAAVVDTVDVMPGTVELIPTGFAVAVPEGFELQIRPRSGMAAGDRVTIINSPGTVDSDFRGEVKVAIHNLGDAPFRITRGQRIAQLVLAPIVQAVWDEVAHLPETARGERGFGHTGSQ